MKNIVSLLFLILCVNLFGAGNSQIITAAAPLTLTSGLMAIPSATSIRNGYLLSTDWSTFNNKVSGSILTTKGDLLGFSTVLGRLGVGTDGQVLTADAASTFGFKWASSTGGVTSVALSLPSIFSVSGSPVTSTGTLTGTLATQSANTVFAGPTTGASLAPTFRALVQADIPSLTASTITSGTIATTNGGTSANSSSSTGLAHVSTGTWTFSAADLASADVTGILGAANGGTGNGFTAFTGPLSSTKTFTLPNVSSSILTSNSAVTVGQGGTGQTTATTAFNALSPMTALGDVIYGGTSGSGTRLAGNTTATKNFLTQTGTGSVSAAPAWGTIAAGDVPTLNQNTSGSAASLSATLGVATGGTGNTTFTPYSVITAGTTATGAFQNVSGVGSSGQVLTSNGASALPTWQAAASSGVTTVGAFSGSSQTNGASISSSTITFGPADGTNPGMVTTGTQTLAGAKTFSSGIVDSASGTALTLSGTTNGDIIRGATSHKITLTDSGFQLGGKAMEFHVATAGAVLTRMLSLDGGTTVYVYKDMNFYPTATNDLGGGAAPRDIYWSRTAFMGSTGSAYQTQQIKGTNNHLIFLTDNGGGNIGYDGTSEFRPTEVHVGNLVQTPSVVLKGYQRVAATSGGNTTINANISALVLHASGTLGSYTVTMPASPKDGLIVSITADQTITTFTLSGNSGQTVVGSYSTLVVGTALRFIWVNTDSEWYPY